MSDPASHAHGGRTEAVPFSAGEWDLLRAEDYTAAKAIVLLMMAIFIMGVLGYIGVCLWVS